MLCCAVVCCVVLWYTVLCSIELYCSVLCCVVLWYASLYTELCSVLPHSSAQRCLVVMCYAVLCSAVLCCAVLSGCAITDSTDLLDTAITVFILCMYANMYVRTYVCMHACMYVCMYIRMYVCTYVCMYVHFLTCAQTYTNHQHRVNNTLSQRHRITPHYAGMTASIPLEKAMSSSGDVLLAFEMNGSSLPFQTGHPIRSLYTVVITQY